MATLPSLAHEVCAEEIAKDKLKQITPHISSLLVDKAFFTLKQSGRLNYFQELDPKPVILNGVIDLVFLEPDGWIIEDYKTDEINGGLQSFIDYYTPQVKVYTESWEKITRKKSKKPAFISRPSISG